MPENSRVAVNQFMVPRMPLDELARWCRGASVTGLGVLRSTIATLGVPAVARTLAAHGVAPTSVCVALGLVHGDAEQRRVRFAEAVIALRQATELGVPLVVVVGGPGPGLPLAQARQQAADRFAALATEAERIGGRILLEPLHPAMVHLSAVTSLAAAGALARSPATGIVLDVWHLWTDPGLETAIDTLAGSVEIVHVSDWAAEPAEPFARELPGAGLIDLPGLAAALLTAGFSGWWEAEVLSEPLTRRHGEAGLLGAAIASTRRMLALAGCRAATDHHQRSR